MTSYKPTLLILISVILGLILTIIGLGNQNFWDDEADTVFVSRNLLNQGKLSGWDGRNLISSKLRGFVDEEMNETTIPPLQYYVVALSLMVFGESNQGARLLPLMIGIMCIFFTALWYKNETKDEKYYWLVGFLLALSPAFLLYISQARYYPLGMTLSMATLWAWSEIKKRKSLTWWNYPICCLFFVLLSLSQYLYAIGIFAVLTFDFIFFNKKSKSISVQYLLIFIVVILELIALANYDNTMIGRTLKNGEGLLNHLDRFSCLMYTSLRDISVYEFFPYALLFISIFLYIKTRTIENWRKSPLIRFIIYIFVYTVAVCWFSPQQSSWFNEYMSALSGFPTDMRYLVPVIPIGCAISIYILSKLYSLGFVKVTITIITILITTNLFYLNLFSDVGFQFRFYQYVKERLYDYDSSTEKVTNYIKKDINKDKCIFMVPLFTSIPQAYYNPLHKFCGMITNKADFYNKNKNILRTDLFMESTIPDYFIVGSKNPKMFQAILNRLYGNKTYKLIDTIQEDWLDQTRPEIPLHSFERPSVTNGKIYIFNRTATRAHFPEIGPDQLEEMLKHYRWFEEVDLDIWF